jgi:hypothetical protein
MRANPKVDQLMGLLANDCAGLSWLFSSKLIAFDCVVQRSWCWWCRCTYPLKFYPAQLRLTWGCQEAYLFRLKVSRNREPTRRGVLTSENYLLISKSRGVLFCVSSVGFEWWDGRGNISTYDYWLQALIPYVLKSVTEFADKDSTLL